jgi:hypothetical protein
MPPGLVYDDFCWPLLTLSKSEVWALIGQIPSPQVIEGSLVWNPAVRSDMTKQACLS